MPDLVLSLPFVCENDIIVQKLTSDNEFLREFSTAVRQGKMFFYSVAGSQFVATGPPNV